MIFCTGLCHVNILPSRLVAACVGRLSAPASSFSLSGATRMCGTCDCCCTYFAVGSHAVSFPSSHQDYTWIYENAPLSWQPFLETLSLNFHAHTHIKCEEQKLGFGCNGTAFDTKTALLPRRVCFKTPGPGPHPHNEPLSAA